LRELSWLGEKEELQCALRGDVRSIKRIVTKLAKPGFHLAYKTLLNVEDAEDCVQESFYQLWRSNNQFQAKSSLKTYFFRFVFNSSFLILKKRKETIWHDLENYNEILNLNINSTIFDESFDLHRLIYTLHLFCWHIPMKIRPHLNDIAKQPIWCLTLALFILPCTTLAHTSLSDIEVVGNYDNSIGSSDSASQGVITSQIIENRPLLRPGEMLE
jgi:hypothetical protein